MFSNKDIQQITAKGSSPETISLQLANFRNAFPFLRLVAPATPSNGILVFDDDQVALHKKHFEENARELNICKFIPASGAASRMFKHLHEFRHQYDEETRDDKGLLKDTSFGSVAHFFQNIEKFAFYADLEQRMAADGLDLGKSLTDKKFGTIIDYLLGQNGLNYSLLPKGLLRFHNYNDGPRLAIEEHLIESANYCVNKSGIVPIHFTVSPEHLEKFKEQISKIKTKYEKELGVKFEITYSTQKSSTDTIAVDMDNQPFREKDGSLHFRPGGHGALIENLNDLESGIVFIKNIDNIVPDRLREPTYLYKKVIGGYLLKLKKDTFRYLELLQNKDVTIETIEEAADFATNELHIDIDKNYIHFSQEEKRVFLYNKLNRPIRVCGMVKNESEPGGGPFWIKNHKGEINLQIVEKSQVDPNDLSQGLIVGQATHFNPVDLVCCTRNYKNEKFDLTQFVDQSTGFISIKSKDGKSLKAQELPGLWNGAMADWITIFVETPIITFNPVKTINDLLRDQHQ
jgi:Domain of unknown function (DUF4301)